MKTIKLTDKEITYLEFETDYTNLNDGFIEDYTFICQGTGQRIGMDLANNELVILNEDIFREFLNDEIKEIKRIDNSSNPHTLILFHLDNLKSILSKLNDAIIETKVLSSVGSKLNIRTGMVYPYFADGKPDVGMGRSIETCTDEWFKSLSDEDVVQISKFTSEFIDNEHYDEVMENFKLALSKINKKEFEINQTIKIDSDFIDMIRANSEHYYDTFNSELTDEKIVEALQKMNDPKYKVTKSLNRLLHGGHDSCDTNNCIEIALYGKAL